MSAKPALITIHLDDAVNRTCFLAIPYGDEFATVRTVVQEAMANARLQFETGDVSTGSSELAGSIRDKISHAMLVVADCSPEPATGKSNPNVLYEVGFAQSMGKRTVLLTRDLEHTAADLRDQRFVMYAASSPDLGRLRHEIAERILQCLSDDGSTVSGHHRVTYLEPNTSQWVLGEPALWLSVVSILETGKSLHNVFQDFDLGHVSQLRVHVEDAATAPNRDEQDRRNREEKVLACRKAWDHLVLKLRVTESTIKSFLDAEGNLEKHFTAILSSEPVTRSGTHSELLSKAREYHKSAVLQVKRFFVDHENLAPSFHSSALDSLLEKNPSKLRLEVHAYSMRIQDLLLSADRLMFNVVSALTA